MRTAAFRLLGLAALAGLSGAIAAAPANPVAAADAAFAGKPNFASDIAPILLDHCASCHRPGRAAPFSLLSYDDARAKAKEIVAATTAGRMPPWLAAQGPGFPTLQEDPRLTAKEIATIARWVSTGMSSGNLRKAPMPPAVPMSWPLGTPDLVMNLPAGVPVPSGEPGTTVNVALPLRFPGELWIRALDYEASDNRVVRHARFFVAPDDFDITAADVVPGVGGLLGTSRLENYSDQLFRALHDLVDLGGWTPGSAPRAWPDRLAVRVRGRSQILLQLHVEPGLTDVVEDGRVAVYFAAPAARRAVRPIEIPPLFGIGAGLSIPAGAAQYRLEDSVVLPADVEAVGARAHAHALARRMTMTAQLPGGAAQGLLRLADWSVNWPQTYLFTTPVRLPRGTTIRVEIDYDNSADNPRQLFTPPGPVTWGRITTGEMGSMTLFAASLTDDEARAIDEAIAAHLRDQLSKKRAR